MEKQQKAPKLTPLNFPSIQIFRVGYHFVAKIWANQFGSKISVGLIDTSKKPKILKHQFRIFVKKKS
jgi:hypothetical protein